MTWWNNGPLFVKTCICIIQECFVLRYDEIGFGLCRIFFYIVNIFLLFHYYLPLEKGIFLHLNELESLYPIMLCASSLVQIGQEALKKKILKSRQHIFIMSFQSPSWKGHNPLVELTGILYTECFVPNLIDNGLLGLEKKMKMC